MGGGGANPRRGHVLPQPPPMAVLNAVTDRCGGQQKGERAWGRAGCLGGAAGLWPGAGGTVRPRREGWVMVRRSGRAAPGAGDGGSRGRRRRPRARPLSAEVCFGPGAPRCRGTRLFRSSAPFPWGKAVRSWASPAAGNAGE